MEKLDNEIFFKKMEKAKSSMGVTYQLYTGQPNEVVKIVVHYCLPNQLFASQT